MRPASALSIAGALSHLRLRPRAVGSKLLFLTRTRLRKRSSGTILPATSIAPLREQLQRWRGVSAQVLIASIMLEADDGAAAARFPYGRLCHKTRESRAADRNIFSRSEYLLDIINGGQRPWKSI